MITSNKNNLERKFSVLQSEFRGKLPDTILEIENIWGDVANNKDIDELKKLVLIVLALADTAGTYGIDEVSYIARKSYLELKSLASDESFVLSSETESKLNEWFMQLSIISKEWLKSDVKTIIKKEKEYELKNNIIYTLLEDEALLKDLKEEIERRGSKTQRFSKISEIAAACKEGKPTAIIIDKGFSDKGIAGTEVVEHLKNNIKLCPPIIFIADSRDAEYKLAVARAGADRYFCKPVIINKVVHTIVGLNKGFDDIPYRVLVIDNDLPLLKCYNAILSESGLEVAAENEPLKGFDSIEIFHPDVIVIDMYMPECSGTELINIIRQDDRWELIPIIILSGEQDINNQLDAMALGADDFLVKPVNTGRLVATINAVAKRARKNVKLNRDLKNSLRENKGQLVTLDQHAIVSTTDVTGKIIHVNDRLCEISGYSREELIGQNHRILKSVRHDDNFYKNLWKTISNGHIWHGVICNKSKSGSEYWVDSTIVPFLNEKGKPYKYVSIRTDMTNLRISEERLHRSQEFANIGTWDWNILTGELFWSDKIWTLFGYNKETTDTTYDNFIEAIHPDDRQMVTDAVASCSEKGEDYNLEHRIVWPDGSTHWVHESGDTIRDENGKALRMLGVVRDITALKVYEEEIITAREESESANRAKSQFLSSMSHELRTPMNAIMGFSQLLKINKISKLTESQHQNVDEIMMAGKHLMQLINDVLDLSKIESEHIDLSINEVVLSSIIIESLQLLMPLAEKRGIEIFVEKNEKEVKIDELGREHKTAFLDETRFKQIILNLLSNAIKYNNENGKITLSYRDNMNGTFSLSITDTGDGLSDEQQKELFKSFNRLGLEQTEIEGSGIGLVITKKLTELMGGKIGVTSKVGIGSTFWVELPFNTSDDLTEKEYINKSTEEEKLVLEERNMTVQDSKKTVLYVEDNPANLRLVEQILECIPNLKMWSAPEPLLGLELAVEHVPDLILLDINLPGMDGYEVLVELRKRDETKNIPVVAISANAMPKDLKKGKEAGFDGYITKPVNIKELLSIVESKI